MVNKILLELCWSILVGVAYLSTSLTTLVVHSFATLRALASRKEVANLYRNVQMVYGLAPKSMFARMFMLQVFRAQARLAIETLRGLMRPQLMRIDGMEAFQAEVRRRNQDPRGQVVISAHLGTWEIAGKCCALANAGQRPFSVLAKPSAYPWFNACLERLRGKLGFLVHWTNNRHLTQDILTGLENGEWIGFVADQKPQGRKGPVVDFFGKKTEFVAGPAVMAIRRQCGVLGIFCVQRGPMHFEMVFESIVDSGHNLEDVQALTQDIARVMEKQIRLNPEQWCWSYRRWRAPEVAS